MWVHTGNTVKMQKNIRRVPIIFWGDVDLRVGAKITHVGAWHIIGGSRHPKETEIHAPEHCLLLFMVTERENVKVYT